MSKILLFHDTFLMKGGAERMNIEIAKSLGADIATAVWSPNCYDAQSMGFTGKIIEIHPTFKKGIIGFLIMKWKFFRSGKLLKEYDGILFSNESITGIWGVPNSINTWYYAHSISRHIFDLKEEYRKKVPALLRPIFDIFRLFFLILYKQEIRKVKQIFTNSKKNQEKILQYFGKESIIIYPGVDTKKFKEFDKDIVMQYFALEGISLNYKDYFLSFARFTDAKGIADIIKTFQEIPERNILLLYGENDSQKDEFLKLGFGYKNIYFHILKDNNNLPYIINGSIATICNSKNEDFGMVTIESMSCGIPVIGPDEGGYQEIISQNKNGILFSSKNPKEELLYVIKNTDKSDYEKLGKQSQKDIERFSIQNMNTNMKQYIK